jgi:hypothetical protein
MLMRKFILILTASSCLYVAASAQEVPSEQFRSSPTSKPSHIEDFSKVVLPISELKFVGIGVTDKFGTGFCLDPECRFIGTNYHVALHSQPRKIRGEKVLQRYLATGPNDEGATLNHGPYLSPTQYTLSRDLAIFELRHPLHQYHGAAYSLNDLQFGQEIEVYAYPKEGISPLRSLTRFRGTFKGLTTSGLLAFDYELSDNKAIRPGASGGIVVDSKTQQIVGILNAVGQSEDNVAIAVPVQSLVEFVNAALPFLAQNLFPSSRTIPPNSTDIFPELVRSHRDGLVFRSEEPHDVKMLRVKSQLLADGMRDFIAVQTFAWGNGTNPPAIEAAYEVQVIDGQQQFREYPNGKKYLKDSPLPTLNTGISTGGDWSYLPKMVGKELGLEIHQAPDVFMNNRRIKVFQYRADREDGACQFLTIVDFIFFRTRNVTTVECYGEVWTDEDTNILRMSEHLVLLGKWKEYQGVVTYGWFKPADDLPRRVPVTISNQAKFKKKTYWCRGEFTNYQLFQSRVKIAAK